MFTSIKSLEIIKQIFSFVYRKHILRFIITTGRCLCPLICDIIFRIRCVLYIEWIYIGHRIEENTIFHPAIVLNAIIMRGRPDPCDLIPEIILAEHFIQKYFEKGVMIGAVKG